MASMASRHQDPFEGLRLDERFVRGARFLEPSAAERSRQHGRPASSRCQVVPASRGLPGFFHRLVAPPRPPGRPRQIARMVTFMAIIVGMITITVVALRQTANRTSPTAARLVPTTSSGSSAATKQTAVPAATGTLTGPPAGFGIRPDLLAALRPGDCLNWTPYPAGSPASVDPVVPVRVSCREPHIDEVTRMVDLAVLFHRWPGASVVAEVTDERCAGALREFPGTVDSTPHRTVGTIYPSEPSWQLGAHAAVCTVRTDDLRPRSGQFRVPGAVAAPEFPRGRPNIR
ncbi:hypothetical protein Francci3_3636 [Frankia casuarinae]|uniref:Septum formation-related domain-containing protein n=3 Tax=Frankiaceae TaxID=74712 RepID=Q2J6V4_FRACC|nr:hypothetical protein Francci3_3636 [Frankia casuarinae]